jgi:AhpD family alkylhydroperoxidase
MTTRCLRLAGVGAMLVLFAGSAAVAGETPEFMKETYPQQAVNAALQDMMALEGKDAALPAKTRELISLGVAAQIPCQYCIYYHTKAAKAAGATGAEIKEAVASAAMVRKWSTVLNGTMYDMDKFHKEVDAMFTAVQ